MSKLHCISNKFSIIAKRHLIFNIEYLKLRNLAKLWLFKLIMKKSNFKKIGYDVILVTLLSLRHQNNVIKNFHFALPLPPSIKMSGYASDFNAVNLV